MVLLELDIPLCIDTDSNGNRRLKNVPPTKEPQELHLFKLNGPIANCLSNINVVEITNCDISELPYGFGDLNLKQLILNYNRLKEIPSCLYSGLESLEVLDLSHNLLREFHIMPACSINIVSLNLSCNKIENFPYWILFTPCPKLREVYYSHNSLRKLENSHELNIQKLEMCNSQLIDVDLKFLKKIRTLEFLDIGNDSDGHTENQFKEIDNLFQRHKWKKMLILKLNNLLISIIPKGLFFLTSLTELHLVHCMLNWIPEEIENLENLQLLDVSHNSICSLPRHLTALPYLSIVKAPFNLIDFVGDFTNNLKILDLYTNKLDNFQFDLSRFGYIDLENNILVTSNFEDWEIYENKVKTFRKEFDLDRTYGSEPSLSTQVPDSDDDSSVSSWSEVFESLEKDDERLHKVAPDETLYYDVECWDEEEPLKKCEEKNPEVTPSDDEWDGEEEIRKRVERKNPARLCFDANEDWIFVDVEEDP